MKDKKPEEQQKIEITERLTDADKALLDLCKVQRELALANMKAVVAQGEVADLKYNNIILQFALKYHLNDGDNINDDGTIKRKEEK